MPVVQHIGEQAQLVGFDVHGHGGDTHAAQQIGDAASGREIKWSTKPRRKRDACKFTHEGRRASHGVRLERN